MSPGCVTRCSVSLSQGNNSWRYLQAQELSASQGIFHSSLQWWSKFSLIPHSPSTPHGADSAWINPPAIQTPPAVPWQNSSHANTFVCLKWQFGTEIIRVSLLANFPAFALPNLHGEQPIIAFSLGGIVCLLQPHKLQMEPNSGFFCVNMENNKARSMVCLWMLSGERAESTSPLKIVALIIAYIYIFVEKDWASVIKCPALLHCNAVLSIILSPYSKDSQN